MAVALVLAAAPAAAAPNEDGQPPTAPSRYDGARPMGWMTSSAVDRVYDIAQIGNTVYVAGVFSGIRPTRTGTVTARNNLAAFDAVTGAPRTGFAPNLNGAAYTLQPSADGSRLYVGGAFTQVNGVNRGRLATLNPTTGAIVTGFTPNLGGGSVRSLVLRDGILYAGGNFASASAQARPQLAAFDTTANGQPLAGWTPAATGGSVLTLELAPDGGRLYVGGRFTAVNGFPASANLVALTRTTGAVDPTFTAQPGREVFDVLADDGGLVWTALGGALGRADVYRADGSLLTRHETEGDVESVERVGGLVYLGGHDIGLSGADHVGVVDPAAPSVMETAPFDEPTTGGDGVWAFHSTGRDLWVGGNTSGPHFGVARYPSVGDPPARVDLVPVLSTWRYLDTAAAPAGWRTPGFDDAGWPSGPAELGFGDTGEATVLRSGRGTYYARQAFTVTDRATLGDLRLDLLADDGAAVHVNGTEVARFNLPTGTLTDASRATSGLAGNAEDTFRSYAVPASVLVEGANTIAVEVHQNSSASSDLSFDARLSAVRAAVDTVPPTVPAGLTAGTATTSSVPVTWTASTDAVGVDRYDVFVDGTAAGSSTTPAFTVVGLAPSSTHTVEVEAVDAAGNRSGRSAPLTIRAADPPPPGPVTYVPRGAVWRYQVVDPGADWAQPSFDDSAWLSGPAELGRGDGDEATLLPNGYTTSWFRRSFTASGTAAVTNLEVEVRADDGSVVYLNGVELVRDNVGPGPVTAATESATYRTGQAELRRFVYVVPKGALVDGTNVLAVSVHQGWGSPDVSLDLRLRSV